MAKIKLKVGFRYDINAQIKLAAKELMKEDK